MGELDSCEGGGRRGRERLVWIKPAKFCGIQYIKDGRYLPASPTADLGCWNSVELYQMPLQETVARMMSFCTVAVRNEPGIDYDEQLFVDQNTSYEFTGR